MIASYHNSLFRPSFPRLSGRSVKSLFVNFPRNIFTISKPCQANEVNV